MKNTVNGKFAIKVLFLALLSSGAVLGSPGDYIAADPDSAFGRGQMAVRPGLFPVLSHRTIGLFGDGNGSVSVEVYVQGRLIGSATAPLPDLSGPPSDLNTQRVLLIKLAPQLGTAEPYSELAGDTLTCHFFTPSQPYGDVHVSAELVVTVRGNVDFAFADAGNHLAQFAGKGMGEIKLNFSAVFELGPI